MGPQNTIFENRSIPPKFSDEQFLVLYKEGHTDAYIARCFECSISTVWMRRCKLKLKANHTSQLTGEDLNQSRKRIFWKKDHKPGQIRSKSSDSYYRNYEYNISKALATYYNNRDLICARQRQNYATNREQIRLKQNAYQRTTEFKEKRNKRNRERRAALKQLNIHEVIK